ncbi:galactose-specific lectin nattectin-like isoform X1 [Syngnathoides biaculeatus]|uniref:galactose-specific lectin nattectin-like isoform X1 n=1 Tax=Syngnathoides biaculeatus TaxID=300417 RepID=UPI002ADE2057|nr:galactose-specific lectin nattectin-like isoform X1 [Syngnathoides biaculeatus]
MPGLISANEAQVRSCCQRQLCTGQRPGHTPDNLCALMETRWGQLTLLMVRRTIKAIYSCIQGLVQEPGIQAIEHELIPITSGITIAKMDFCLHLLLLLCCISGLFTGAWAFAINRDRYCPPEWTRLDNRCLIFQNEELNFALAETVCNILGGNLVSIHNSLENEVVRHLILAGAGSFQRSWIGLYDRIVDGEFLFTDGSPFDFDDWANGRPRVDTNQDCVEINFQGETWNDIRCAVRRSFVCAKDLKH